MAIVKKSPRAEKQLNIKITVSVRARYEAVKKACQAKGWDFRLQPELTEWLNTQLTAAEKELADDDKALAKKVTETGAGA
ncbi:hypothetical protein [Humidesulfovibrio sp.]